jgi:hypothetical protein
MSEEELRRAIDAPAARSGHPFDSATVDLLIAQTARHEGILPLLQFALTRIWEGLAEGITPADTLQRIGGVGGALAGEAERLYARLQKTDQVIARLAFLGLVRLGEGARDTRQRVSVSDLIAYGEDPSHVREVLRTFSQPGARLITLAAELDGTDTAEVTHEALFEQWSTLKTWLDSSRNDLRFHRRLADAAHHWHTQGRPEGLLWRAPDLDLLRAFYQRAGGDLTATEMAFLQAAVRHERRTRWLKRAAVVFLIALVCVASGGAYIAIEASQQARQAQRTSRVRELGALYLYR